MLRAGLLGYGFSGRCFHAPFLGPAGFELVAVSTSREAEVKKRWPDTSVHESAEEVIARGDIDLVVVATPNDSHARLSIAALKAGKHVVVDKPMALDLSEAQSIADAARAADRSLFVFHNRRWDADFLTVRKALDSGELGRIFAFETHFNRHALQGLGRWRGAVGPGSGLLADLGPHVVDQALVLFGRPDWIWADLQTPRGAGTTDEAFMLRLGYGDRRATLAASLFVGETSCRAVVHAEAGSLILSGTDMQEQHLLDGMDPRAEGFGRFAGGAVLTGPDGTHQRHVETGRYLSFYEGVRAALEDGAAPPIALDEALQVMGVLDAARTSAAEGRRVALG